MSPRADFPASVALHEAHLLGEALLECTDAGMSLWDAFYSLADRGPFDFVEAYHCARALARDYRAAA